MKPPEEHIPPRRAIIPYYIVAAFAFTTLSLLCLISAPSFTGHYFQPKLLAITHLAVFGWATMIIFGASNQLTPVICEQRLYSTKIPVWVFSFLTIGTVILVTSFWQFSFTTVTYIGAGLLLTAILLQAYNIYKTAYTGKGGIVRDFMLMSHIWLAITAIVGIMLLVNLRFPFLPEEHLHYLEIHASIGMAGWFVQLIIGISSRLIPMFLLSRDENKKLLNISYYTINIGLTFFLMESMVLKTTRGLYFYVLIILAGLISYMLYARQCYKTAMRKQLDGGMRHTFMALALMGFTFLLLLFSLLFTTETTPNVFVAYGFSFFAGFISTIIMGQTFKTLPFIVWMHITKPGTLPEMLPKDLFNEQWVKWQMLLYLPGFMLFLSGILLKQTMLIYAGGTFMLVSSAWYFLHVLLIINRLKR